MAGTIVACCIAADCAAQPGWKPGKNVEFIVGVSPGGGVDRTARTLQRVLHDRRMLEVSSTVVNKPGGGSTLAQAYLNQHAGDAHYLEIAATSILTNQIIGKTPNSWSDFTPVAMLCDEFIGFAVKADSPRNGSASSKPPAVLIITWAAASLANSWPHSTPNSSRY
ncbi:MAG TPA: hypothetical protein VGQ88_01920 [Burkholderiales bacterium]|nr:hypothetical protein [Burkholderiales bacterium]